MKFKITLIFVLLISTLNAQTWQDVGSAPFAGLTTYGQEMIVRPNGHPVVAYIDDASPTQVRITEWNGTVWQMLPPINPALSPNLGDLNLVSNDDNIYLGVGSNSGMGYEVYRLDGAVWTSLDDAGQNLLNLNYTGNTVKLAVSDQFNNLVLTYSAFGGNGDLPNAMVYDGLEWDVTMGDELNMLFATAVPGETNPIKSRVFQNGPNTYYYSIQTEPGGGAFITNGNAMNKQGGFDELRLYKYEGASWELLTFGAGPDDFIQNDPALFTMDGNQAGGFPTIAYTSNDQSDIIRFQQLDGAGNYTALADFNPLMPINNMNIALDNIDLPYVALSFGTSNNQLIHYNGSGWDYIGAEYYSGTTSFTDVEVFKSSNKVYVLFMTDGGLKIRVLNDAPQVVTSPSVLDICQDATSETIVSDLELVDYDHDSVYVVSATSSDAGILQNANIVVNRTSVYNYTSSENHFSLAVTPESGQNGQITVTVTYSDGFVTDTELITFWVNSLPTVGAGPDHVICEGSTVTLNGSGASTYTWDNGVTNAVAFNPGSAGSYVYTVTGTDATGCQATDAATVTVNQLPTFTVAANNILCNGNADGEISISGLSNSNSYDVDYDYNASPATTVTTSSDGGGNITLNSLVAGNYNNFSIQDNITGCISATDATLYTITEPSQINILSEADQTLCEGSSVTLNGNAVGGTGTLVYTWDNAVIDGSPFTPSVGSLPYTVTATDDNGCFTSDVALNITVNPAPPIFSTSFTNPTTCGGTDGDISLIGLDASTTYDISYNDGALQGPTAMTSNATGTIIISGLAAGAYSNFDVTNTDGCITSNAGSVSLSDPGSPFVNTNSNQTVCANNNFSDVLFTGTAGAVFSWTNDNTSIGLTGSGTGDIIGFTGLNTGIAQEVATIIVTPTFGGCTGASESFTFTVNPLDDAGFNYSSTSLCSDETLSPTVNTNTAGGTFNYVTITGGPTLMLSASNGAIGIASSNVGSYDITYTTAGTCPNSSIENITIHSAPTITITQPTIQICNNASPIDLEGVATPLGGNYIGAGVINNSFDPNPLSIDGYGYAYNYTDANGCSATGFGTIEILEIPDIDLTITNTTCSNNNGSAISSVTGGLPPYDYYWSNGTDGPEITNLGASTYYLNITDANDCYVMDVATIQSSEIDITYAATDNSCAGDANGAIDLIVNGSTGPYTFYWSNGETTEDISNLYSGQYEVFVTDINGCMSTQTINIAEPAPISSEINATQTTACGSLDGDLSASIDGGVPTYTFSWTNSAGSVVGTAASLTNVGEGFYTLTTTDLVGCTHISNGVISEPGAPIVTVNELTAASCLDDGAIDIDISTLNTIQSIDWSNNETTEDISGLSAGNYSVIVTDNNGCIGNLNVNLEPVYPDFTEICMVTVDSNTTTNLVIWEKPITTEIDYFIVYRETSVAGQFLAVDTIQYEDESAFTDPVAYPQLRSWRYKLAVVNNCGVKSELSPAHKTMHITIAEGTPGTYEVNWDNYEGFTFPTFDLYRHTELNGWELLSNLPTTTFSYSDIPPSDIGLDYMITITPPSICTSTKAQDHNTSRSNTSSSILIPPGEGDNATDGITETELENLMLIYPNPSTSFFNVYLNTQINHSITVNVYDIKGSVIQTFEVNKSEFIVQLKNFEAGMYILEINTGSAIVRKQLIKK